MEHHTKELRPHEISTLAFPSGQVLHLTEHLYSGATLSDVKEQINRVRDKCIEKLDEATDSYVLTRPHIDNASGCFMAAAIAVTKESAIDVHGAKPDIHPTLLQDMAERLDISTNEVHDKLKLMSKEEAMEHFLSWNGIQGFTSLILAVSKNLDELGLK